MITVRELPADAEHATRQVNEFRCELWNETDRIVRAYVCNADWLRVYLLNPRDVMRDVWIRAGHNALSAFSVGDQTCLESGCFDLTGAVCILIGPKAVSPESAD